MKISPEQRDLNENDQNASVCSGLWSRHKLRFQHGPMLFKYFSVNNNQDMTISLWLNVTYKKL